MSRRTKEVQITDNNRDKGKVFVIKEMPSDQGFDWGARALLALGRNIEIPKEIADQGLAGLAMLGPSALTKLDWKDAKPLMTEMFECIGYYPAANKALCRGGSMVATTGPMLPDDIEEIQTRIFLCAEWFALHLGFLRPGKQSGQTSGTTSLAD